MKWVQEWHYKDRDICVRDVEDFNKLIAVIPRVWAIRFRWENQANLFFVRTRNVVDLLENYCLSIWNTHCIYDRRMLLRSIGRTSTNNFIHYSHVIEGNPHISMAFHLCISMMLPIPVCNELEAYIPFQQAKPADHAKNIRIHLACYNLKGSLSQSVQSWVNYSLRLLIR